MKGPLQKAKIYSNLGYFSSGSRTATAAATAPELVGGWATHLKNMRKPNWIISPRGENKKLIWNHHLVDIYIYKYQLVWRVKLGDRYINISLLFSLATGVDIWNLIYTYIYHINTAVYQYLRKSRHQTCMSPGSVETFICWMVVFFSMPTHLSFNVWPGFGKV